ncbi:hypothetical protein T10_992 [Trichinella papuae]|uniref:Uncharacterized protein n=1 Tax=Trichinella papuae TaxID=268474 RepID=A0A0V1MKX2_9BILA|nr:hypothetical protein T10_992 [Trichinella papuae]
MENELPKFCSFVKIASVITLKCVEIYSVANHVALYLNSGYGTYGSKIGSYPCTFVSVSKLSSSLNKVCDSTGLFASELDTVCVKFRSEDESDCWSKMIGDHC